MKKFELVREMSKEFFGVKLYRIRALISFRDINAGDVGGWVEKEECLSQHGNAWVRGNAVVRGNARVSGDAVVSGNAVVRGNAWVSGNARVRGNADLITIGPIGSENGFLTAFIQKDNSILVRRGCFSGLIDEFESAVNERHGGNKHGDIYRALIQVIKLKLSEVKPGGMACAYT